MMRIHFSLLHLFRKPRKSLFDFRRRDFGDELFLKKTLGDRVLLFGMYDGGPVTEEPSQVPGG